MDMGQIRADEISRILKEQISQYSKKLMLAKQEAYCLLVTGLPVFTDWITSRLVSLLNLRRRNGYGS